jgi:hypothetical protein
MATGSWDGRGQGSWEFTPEQYQRVVRYLKENHVGIVNAILTRDLIKAFPDIEGRALRAIQARSDAEEYVLCSGDWGVFVAEYAEDAERSAKRFFSQAAKMNQRARAKTAYALEHLPRRQYQMFGEEPPEAPDEDDAIF